MPRKKEFATSDRVRVVLKTFVEEGGFTSSKMHELLEFMMPVKDSSDPDRYLGLPTFQRLLNKMKLAGMISIRGNTYSITELGRELLKRYSSISHHEWFDRATLALVEEEIERTKLQVAAQPTDDDALYWQRSTDLLAHPEACGLGKPIQPSPVLKMSSTVDRFLRNPVVCAQVRLRAEGRCENCGAEPKFIAKFGRFFDVHHLVALADGGQDSVDNSVHLCPNCHRRMHVDEHKSELRREIVTRLGLA